MVAVVTGARGFIGSALVTRLLAEGHEVRVVTRTTVPAVTDCSLLKAFVLDLLRPFPPKVILGILEGADVVFHCAGETKRVECMRQLHVDATKRLAEAASGGLGRWVQLSSVGVYGPRTSGIVDEDSAANPANEYERTKLGGDEVVADIGSRNALEYSILRPSIVFGPTMTNESVFSLIRTIAKRQFVFIGPPGAVANYVALENVVDALMLCGTNPRAAGRTYIVNDHRRWERVVYTIADCLGVRRPSIRVPKGVALASCSILGRFARWPLSRARVDAMTGRCVYSTRRIEQELGYAHGLSAEDAMRGMVEAWRGRR